MTLKKCSCGNLITTKNAQNIKRADYSEFNLTIKQILQFDCKKCGSTFSVARKISKNENRIY